MVDGGVVCGGFSAADIVVRSQPEPHDDDGVHNGGMHYVIIIIIIGSNCTFENSLWSYFTCYYIIVRPLKCTLYYKKVCWSEEAVWIIYGQT